MNTISSVASTYNPFPAIWRAFSCKSRGRSDRCALPERKEDLPDVIVEGGSEGFPYQTDMIPGTRYTYEQLNQAMQQTATGRGFARGTDCMAVHKVMDHLRNPVLVYEIISTFATSHPRWSEFSGRATIRDIRAMFSHMLRQFTRHSNWLYHRPGADVVAVSVNLVSEALREGRNMTIGSGRSRIEIEPAIFVIMLLFFIGELPPRMQTEWAENYIKDNIEAYIRDRDGNLNPHGCSFEEWPRRHDRRRGQCEVSCARGAVERIFLGLSAEFSKLRYTRIDENALRQHEDFAAREAARKEAEAKAAHNALAEAAKKDLETQKRGAEERKRLVQRWSGDFLRARQDQWGNIDPIAVRNHILAEADKETEFHNTHNEWDASMKEYFNEVGGDPSDLGTMIGLRATEGNKWENISKRNNEVKEGGRRKKRKKTRKGKKKKNRKKTRKQ